MFIIHDSIPLVVGQIELYTHIPVMRQLVETLQKWDFRICGVFLVDSQFMIEPSKFISGILTALSTMVNLEIPHVNVMTKIDLLSKKAKKELERLGYIGYSIDPFTKKSLIFSLMRERDRERETYIYSCCFYLKVKVKCVCVYQLKIKFNIKLMEAVRLVPVLAVFHFGLFC